MDYAVWNTLHDGLIDSVHGTVPGNVTVHIGISYLCHEIPNAAEYVLVYLRACTLFEYVPFGGTPITELAQLDQYGIEVLSATREGDIISVCCAGGILKLAYARTETTLADGTPTSQGELEAAAGRYWTKWSKERPRG